MKPLSRLRRKVVKGIKKLFWVIVGLSMLTILFLVILIGIILDWIDGP